MTEFQVGDQTYKVLGFLGKSRADVFLVKDGQEKKWVLKVDKTKPRRARAYYQFAATQFYLEHGVKVPRVHAIAVEQDSVSLVIEYFEGLVSKD